MQPEVQQELLKLLRRLMQDVDAKRYFNEAVDPDALGIPEYREIIKEPMDLGLVFWKLKDLSYKDLASFFSDLHRVWQNCQKFNLWGSPVYTASEKLCTLFETWWNRSRKQLKLEEGRFAFTYQRPPRPATASTTEGEGTRRRRMIVKRTFDDSISSPTLPALAGTQQKLKIKLGKGTKRDQAPRNKPGSLFGKPKERAIDRETVKRLESCVVVLEKLNQSSHAAVLDQSSLQATFVPSLSEISASLLESRGRNWARSPYLSSKDVLHEAGLYLRSQAVKNEHRRKIVSACQALLKSLEKLWIEAGLVQDVEALKGSTDGRLQETGKLPESNLRVTKARMEKLKRQEMEKEVKEAEEAISGLEQSKAEVEKAKADLDRAKDALRESSRNWNASYREKLTQLTELSKAKTQAQKHKDKALASIKASQAAISRLREKEAVLAVLKEKEAKLLTAMEDAQSKLEVFPRDAVLVDIRQYAKKQKTKADTSIEHLTELGSFWLSMPL